MRRKYKGPGSGERRHAALVTLAVAVVVFAGCSRGIPQEKFDAIQRDLLTETERSQSLETQLTQERASVASLDETAEEVEKLKTALERERVRAQSLESELAQALEITTDHEERVHKAEVQEALLAILLAWNRKDSEAFTAGFTENGRSGLPELIGEPNIAIRRIMRTEVSGDNATIHAMFALGTQRRSVRESMVREEGVWKIDGAEQLSPKIPGGTDAVNMQLNESEFVFDSNAISSGNIAFTLENVGEQPHQLVLRRVLEDGQPLPTIRREEFEGMEFVASVDSLQPGEQINVAFTRPLVSGRYVLACLLPDLDDPESPSHYDKGMVSEFTVP